MNQNSETNVIPLPAWLTAAVLGGGLAVFLLTVAMPKSNWPEPFQVCFSICMGLVLGGYVLLIGYVNGDAQRRGMRHVMWTLLSIFIPNGIGIILYFILREPLPRKCPQCGASVSNKGGAYCPACGGAMVNTCPACHAVVDPNWSHCVQCGKILKGENS